MSTEWGVGLPPFRQASTAYTFPMLLFFNDLTMRPRVIGFAYNHFLLQLFFSDI